MNNKYYVYKFLDENGNVIYVGKTTNIKQRMQMHFGKSKESWKDKVSKIVYSELKSFYDMTLYEIYYIGIHKPTYNTEYIHETDVYVRMPQISFVNLKDFSNEDINASIPKHVLKKHVKILGDDQYKLNTNICNIYDKRDYLNCLSNSWFENKENENKHNQLINNIVNFVNNITPYEISNKRVSVFICNIFYRTEHTCRGFKRTLNKYDTLSKEEFINIKTLAYAGNIFIRDSDTEKRNKACLDHFLDFISRSAVVNNEDILVYCPSARVRDLYYKYLEEE